MWFKIKGQKADVNKKRVPDTRLEARAERLVAILQQRPRHPKHSALKAELLAIMEEMRVRDEDAVAFITRLDSK